MRTWLSLVRTLCCFLSVDQAGLEFAAVPLRRPGRRRAFDFILQQGERAVKGHLYPSCRQGLLSVGSLASGKQGVGASVSVK